jgi:hypothetical protein
LKQGDRDEAEMRKTDIRLRARRRHGASSRIDHRRRNVLDRRLRIEAMLGAQVDRIDFQSPERSFDRRADAGRALEHDVIRCARPFPD